MESYLPIRGGNFRRFRLSLPKRSRFVGSLLRRADLQAARGADGGGGGGGCVRGEPHGRGARGVWRRAVVDADLVRAPDAHGLPHAHAAGGYESIAGYEEVRHALANSALTHSLPTYSTALFPQRGWPTCESSWVALAKVSTNNCWPPIFDVVASGQYRRPAPPARRRWRGSSLASASRRRRAICRWSSRSTRGRSSPSFET